MDKIEQVIDGLIEEYARQNPNQSPLKLSKNISDMLAELATPHQVHTRLRALNLLPRREDHHKENTPSIQATTSSNYEGSPFAQVTAENQENQEQAGYLDDNYPDDTEENVILEREMLQEPSEPSEFPPSIRSHLDNNVVDLPYGHIIINPLLDVTRFSEENRLITLEPPFFPGPPKHFDI